MIADLVAALRELFVCRRGRLQVGALITMMALVPVTEILVASLFASLVIHGADILASDHTALVNQLVLFICALVATKVIGHGLHLARVRLFAARFADLQKRSPSKQAWEWAMALELTNVLISIIQVVTFSLLFFYFSPLVAILNAIIIAAMMALQQVLYLHERHRQLQYLTTGTGPGSAPISDRVGNRILRAEIGAVGGSVGMGLVLLLILTLTLSGQLSPDHAVTLFLGLRLLYGQVGNVASGSLRFARAAARAGLVKTHD